MDITDATFLEVITEGKGFQALDFWAPWCGPCRIMEPALREATEELGIEMHKMLVDDNSVVPMRYGVQGIPTVILFHNGQEVDRIVGAQPKRKIVQIFKNIIEKTNN